MRVLVVDDESLARLRLVNLLEDVEGYEVVGEAANGEEAFRLCEALHPEIVLLDIRMPGMGGIETARHLAELPQPPAVIFTTAYDQHALEAFETNAVDYLLKPVRPARLGQALEKAQRLNRAQLSGLRDEGGDDARTQLCVRNRGGLQLVPIADVIFFMADQKYVTVQHQAGAVLIEESLKSLEQEFGDRFVRVHRNALVARAFLEGLERDREGHSFVRLRGVEERIEVSRRHLSEVRQHLRGMK